MILEKLGMENQTKMLADQRKTIIMVQTMVQEEETH